MTTVKPAHLLTFRDLLSQLDFERACKILGLHGRRLIQDGSKFDLDPRDDIDFRADHLRASLSDGSQKIVAEVAHRTDARYKLAVRCSACEIACVHVGALLSFVLENKTILNLAAPPVERVPVESLPDEELTTRAIADRKERARHERMKIRSSDPSRPWVDSLVVSLVSGKTYRVSLRGFEVGESYCSCPDFRTNTLGVCKHIFKVIAWTKKRFTPQQLRAPYRRRRTAVLLHYGRDIELRLEAPDKLQSTEVEKLLHPVVNRPIADIPDLLRRLKKLETLEHPFHIYPDAEEYIQQHLHRERIRDKVAEIRQAPGEHPWRTGLLQIPLLPYQLDGAAFAVGAGRAVLADDMGLGKTIQGVAVAEMLAQLADIRKVLIVCPASLKSQWRSEIQRFCDREVQLVGGLQAERTPQYVNSAFFTVCNYEQVIKDILSIEQVSWDLIILDEAQRIKNWESKTARIIKGLKSRFALVLTGTPLENRLEELYSVVQFIDDRRLGPGFRFLNAHRMVDEKGRILGYKNLDQLRERLAPILLRRTRESVKLQLPERTIEIVRVTPTDEQKVLHDSHMQTVAAIVAKKHLTEMDLLRLRAALLMCRMSANGTFLITKEPPNLSTKFERFGEILDGIAEEPTRKVVFFSEWTTTLDLVEPMLRDRKLDFVRLDGSVPQKKRQELVHRFQTDSAQRFFLTTNAGSTGLNLQSANTVVNFDLPWNPAILEQRIARAHRMGQKRPVHVYVMVTEKTIEESLLATLSAKKDLALAALDVHSEVTAVQMQSGAEQLKARLEILLGAKPEMDFDKTKEREEETQLARSREKTAAAAGEMFGAMAQFLGTVAANQTGLSADPAAVAVVRAGLGQCLTPRDDGKVQLTLTLPSAEVIDQLAQALALFFQGKK